jgi:menaquinone-specific isochorismate synthase
MEVLPLSPTQERSPEAFGMFLGIVRDLARSDGRPRLVSITLETERLDPLAVLGSIHEERELHFYCERPDRDLSVGAAECAVSASFEGATRFADAAAFVRDVLDRTIAVGDVELPFGGPHFFATFGFGDIAASGAAFPSARVFVPSWQVARDGERSVAVANALIAPDADTEAIAARILRAHATFSSFDYSRATPSAGAKAGVAESEVGRTDWFRDGVRVATDAIEAGEFEKIVLARAKDLLAGAAFDPPEVLNGLRARFPNCFAFSVGNGEGSAFIGASPETLIRARAGRLETEALAGSAPRGKTAAEDAALATELLRSDKDLREHAIVLDSIRRRLARCGITLDEPGRPRVRQLSNVQHLLTPVTAALPAGADLLRVVGELHPTPAVGGTPREAAVRRIAELEPFERGLYAGALGWVDHRGDGEFFVGIRSAVVEGPKARLFAGAGIVRGSDPDQEFAETDLKFAALRDALLGVG